MSQSSGMTNICAMENVTRARWKQAMEEGGGGTSAFRQAAFPQSYPNMIFWAHPERTKVVFFSPPSCGKIKWIFPDKQPDSSTSTSQKVNCSGLLLNIDLICKRPDAAGLNKCHLLPFQFTFLVFWHFVSPCVHTRASIVAQSILAEMHLHCKHM